MVEFFGSKRNTYFFIIELRSGGLHDFSNVIGQSSSWSVTTGWVPWFSILLKLKYAFSGNKYLILVDCDLHCGAADAALEYGVFFSVVNIYFAWASVTTSWHDARTWGRINLKSKT